jgi:N-acetylglucosamine-6-sulfatase
MRTVSGTIATFTSVVVATAVVLLPATVTRDTSSLAAEVTPPNVLVVMTDDQRLNTLQTMPTVRSQLVSKGANYVGMSPTSACCPSRTSFLSGQFSHTTGVYNNVDQEWGGWPQFNESGYEAQNIATELDAAGYHTGLVGKYLNNWNKAPEGFVPPGWDVFRAIYSPTGQGGGRYYDYQLRGTHDTEVFAHNPRDYSTDVLADRAVRFLKYRPADQPFFLLFTPYAPHSPYTPAPRHEGTWEPAKQYDNAAVNEADMSDKPAFMQDLPRVDRSAIDRAQDKTGESLKAVDQAVARMLRQLSGSMQDTLIIFTSDQGVMWGEHRLTDKYLPYKWATEYPVVMRWDGHVTPGHYDRMVANVDLAATILDAAGVTPYWPMEGASVFDVARSSVVLEAISVPVHPAYCGVRLRNWLYVKWSGGAGTEMYDYGHDPYETSNLAGKPAYDDKEAELRALTEQLCSPTPPGYVP